MIDKISYKEGTWFTVPLFKGGYAVGRISKMSKNGKILLGYFFGPRVKKVPDLEELKNYKPEDKILICRFGFLGLKNKEWMLIGSTELWEPERWSMSTFQMKDPLVADQYWRVNYANDDPSKEIRREIVSLEVAKDLPEDGLAGHVFVEETLDKLLN